MFWLLQSGFFDAGAFAALRACLDAHDVAHAVVAVNTRTLALAPEPQPAPGERVFACGSSSLGRACRARGWTPGYFDDNLDARMLARHYGEHMLNADAQFVPLREAEPCGETVFVRPASDLKPFAGGVMTRAEFLAWRDATLSDIARGTQPRLAADDAVVLARPKSIHAEVRLRVVDGRIVGASLYRRGGAAFFSDAVDESFLAFGRERIAQWVPDRAFCLDVADTPDGLRVVEINSINSSAFYATDIARFVEAIEHMAF